MKKHNSDIVRFIILLLVNITISSQAQYLNLDEDNTNQYAQCTSIMLGRLATTDGLRSLSGQEKKKRQSNISQPILIISLIRQ